MCKCRNSFLQDLLDHILFFYYFFLFLSLLIFDSCFHLPNWAFFLFFGTNWMQRFFSFLFPPLVLFSCFSRTIERDLRFLYLFCQWQLAYNAIHQMSPIMANLMQEWKGRHCRVQLIAKYNKIQPCIAQNSHTPSHSIANERIRVHSITLAF